MIHETEQDYKLEIRDSQNLAENEEQRNLRLQRLRESRSLEKVNPYEYKRKQNSKDMTDYRSLVTTLLEERQNLKTFLYFFICPNEKLTIFFKINLVN